MPLLAYAKCVIAPRLTIAPTNCLLLSLILANYADDVKNSHSIVSVNNTDTVVP